MYRFVHLSIFLISTSFLFAQDFNLTGAGARAEGFGGAFIGLADDATAVVWNPAGLSQLERPEASIVARFISNGAKYTDNFDASLNEDESQSYFSFNFGSFATPVSLSGLKIVAAIAYQRQLDFYKKFKKEYRNPSNPSQLWTVNSDASGGANTITPAIALKLNPMISVGLSANIWTGSLNSTDKMSVASIGFNGSYTENTELNFSGFNFVLGGLADFESSSSRIPLKLGVTLKTPFTLFSDGTFKENDQIFTGTTDNYDVKQEIAMPLMLGFGASYRIGDNFTIALDYEMRMYGDKEISTDAASKSSGLSGNSKEKISQSGNNLNEFRIGAEYLIVMEQGIIPLRLGFKTVPTPLSKQTYSAANGDYIPTSEQVSGSGIAIGSGYITDRFAIDVTLSSVAYTQEFDTDGKIDFSIGTLSTSVIIYF